MSETTERECPFCGFCDIGTHLDSEQGFKWGYVMCSACGARGPEVRTNYDFRPDAKWRGDAIAVWKVRTEGKAVAA